VNGRLAAVTLVLLVASAAVPTTAGAAGAESDSALTVDLTREGDAELTLTLAYDLTSDEEREAFATLRDDAEARNRTTATFRSRMESVAGSAANATGRSMTVSGASSAFRTTDGGDTGVVVLSVNWTAFAAVDGDRLTVGEPFASGFESDYPVRLVAPSGYELDAAAVSPDDRDGRTAVWNADTALDGFEATFAAADDESTGTVDGFGPVAALVALAGAVLLGNRRA
jgi:hypothetical protein